VNFSATTARQVDVAVELCRAFGAHLVERAVLPIFAVHEATSDHNMPRFTSTANVRQPLPQAPGGT
jgi:hypothetical protein